MEKTTTEMLASQSNVVASVLELRSKTINDDPIPDDGARRTPLLSIAEDGISMNAFFNLLSLTLFIYLYFLITNPILI